MTATRFDLDWYLCYHASDWIDVSPPQPQPQPQPTTTTITNRLLIVETSSATTESRVESDDSSVCPAPGASSSARSYAAVVAGQAATQGLCSLVRSQRSEVNFRRSC